MVKYVQYMSYIFAQNINLDVLMHLNFCHVCIFSNLGGCLSLPAPYVCSPVSCPPLPWWTAVSLHNSVCQRGSTEFFGFQADKSMPILNTKYKYTMVDGSLIKLWVIQGMVSCPCWSWNKYIQNIKCKENTKCEIQNTNTQWSMEQW